VPVPPKESTKGKDVRFNLSEMANRKKNPHASKSEACGTRPYAERGHLF
jgi:hypothetical protein